MLIGVEPSSEAGDLLGFYEASAYGVPAFGVGGPATEKQAFSSLTTLA